MRSTYIIIGALILIALGAWYLSADHAMAPENIDTTIPTEESDVTAEKTAPEETDWPFEAKPDLIRISSVEPNGAISSPLTITGEARGYWFFEADFPVVLTNWDGLIIAEGIAVAQSEWMTEDFVPFTVTLEFTSPYKEGDPDFMKRGSLILHRSNPSDLPENDDALEIPIIFDPVR